LQNSDDSEREKKKERLGMVAVVVCYSGVSRGGFYRLGGEREHGHKLGAMAGNFPCAAAPVMTLDAWVIRAGTAEPPHALWHRSLTSATARTRTLVG
jgi:hypothetical protein